MVGSNHSTHIDEIAEFGGSLADPTNPITQNGSRPVNSHSRVYRPHNPMRPARTGSAAAANREHTDNFLKAPPAGGGTQLEQGGYPNRGTNSIKDTFKEFVPLFLITGTNSLKPPRRPPETHGSGGHRDSGFQWTEPVGQPRAWIGDQRPVEVRQASFLLRPGKLIGNLLKPS